MRVTVHTLFGDESLVAVIEVESGKVRVWGDTREARNFRAMAADAVGSDREILADVVRGNPYFRLTEVNAAEAAMSIQTLKGGKLSK